MYRKTVQLDTNKMYNYKRNLFSWNFKCLLHTDHMYDVCETRT